MNPLTLLPLLAVALAAPHQVLVPGLQTVQQVQVPLTQNIHYENRPVVTGYQTTVLKPNLVSAPLVTGLSPALTLRQLPDIPITTPNTTSDLPTPAPSAPADLPIGPPADVPAIPGIPGQMPPAENGTGSDMGGGSVVPVPIPGSPIVVGGVPSLLANNYFGVNPYQLSVAPVAAVRSANDAVVIDARSVPVQQVAVRAAQAGDFGPLVTQERVLAPVRTHTQITPQVTQIQPEVTVRRVIQDVPVHTPVAVQQQVFQQQVIPQQLLPQQVWGGQNIISGARLVL